MAMDVMILFLLLLLVVSFLYASVGHGGASGYLALMAIFQFTPAVMKPTALLLNLLVSLMAFVQYYRARHFKWDLFYPLVLTSVPMAFLGGLTTLDNILYKKILGCLLIIPVIRFLFTNEPKPLPTKKNTHVVSLFIGGIIGYISGLIGIGGGILLSPVLLFLNWTDQKQTASICALFIFINSLAGLLGQWVTGLDYSPDMMKYMAVTFLGGTFGAYFGAIRFPQKTLKIILSLVLTLASYKLIFTTA